MTVSPPARSSRASAAMKRSVLWIHSISGELQASTLINLGSSRMRLLRGRVIEAHGAADHRRRRATAAVPEDLVAVADQLARQVEELRRGNARLAGQPVALAVRHERKVAGPQEAGVRALDLEPALAGRHDVEHQAGLASAAARAPTARVNSERQ